MWHTLGQACKAAPAVHMASKCSPAAVPSGIKHADGCCRARNNDAPHGRSHAVCLARQPSRRGTGAARAAVPGVQDAVPACRHQQACSTAYQYKQAIVTYGHVATSAAAISHAVNVTAPPHQCLAGMQASRLHLDAAPTPPVDRSRDHTCISSASPS